MDARDLVITDNEALGGGGIYVGDGRTLDLVDAQLTRNHGGFGGHLVVDGGVARVQDTTFDDGTSVLSGGAVHVQSIGQNAASFTCTDCVFTGNQSDGDGGGLMVSGPHVAVSIVRGSIDGNDSAARGGGICFLPDDDATTTLALQGTSFGTNQAASRTQGTSQSDVRYHLNDIWTLDYEYAGAVTTTCDELGCG